ncbi:MAG: acyl-CoA dehydrogenase family protein [Rubrobacter sp.]
MDFALTERQRQIKDEIARFADEEVAPGAAERDATDTYPNDIFERLSEMDYMGLSVPQESGGAGEDFVSYAIALEELSRADAGVGATLAVHTSAGTLPILLFGTEEQKRRWVPQLASGEKIGCFMLTEPNIGSDTSAMEATAEKVDGGYSLMGHKQWITNGRIAETGIVFARIPDVGPTAFILPMDAAGLSFGRHAKKMGVISATTDDVILDNVFVSERDLLGEPGKGLRVALGTLDPGRIGIAAQATGIAEAAFRHATAFAAERKTFGKAIAEHQAIAFKLAEMQVKIRAARLLTYEAAWLKDAGERVTEAGARAKLFASQTANEVAFEAVQILGGRGYMRDEGPVERLYRDARVTEIYEGTSEIQKLVLSRAILREHAASLETPAGVEENTTVVG